MTATATEQPVMFEVSEKTKAFILSRLAQKTLEKNSPLKDEKGMTVGFADITDGIYLKEPVTLVSVDSSTVIYASQEALFDLLAVRISTLENC